MLLQTFFLALVASSVCAQLPMDDFFGSGDSILNPFRRPSPSPVRPSAVIVTTVVRTTTAGTQPSSSSSPSSSFSSSPSSSSSLTPSTPSPTATVSSSTVAFWSSSPVPSTTAWASVTPIASADLSSDQGGLSAAWIAGIILGAIFLVIVCTIIYFVSTPSKGSNLLDDPRISAALPDHRYKPDVKGPAPLPSNFETPIDMMSISLSQSHEAHMTNASTPFAIPVTSQGSNRMHLPSSAASVSSDVPVLVSYMNSSVAEGPKPSSEATNQRNTTHVDSPIAKPPAVVTAAPVSTAGYGYHLSSGYSSANDYYAYVPYSSPQQQGAPQDYYAYQQNQSAGFY